MQFTVKHIFMRILFMNIEFPPLGGGAATQSYYIAREMAKRNLDVTVITSHYKALKREDNVDGVKIYRIPTVRKRLDYASPGEIAAYFFSNTLHAARMIKKFQFDVLLVFFAVPCGISALLLKKIFKKPYVLSLRGADVPYFEPRVYNRIYPFTVPFFKAACFNAKHVIANSPALKSMAAKFYSGEMHVIPNGIDTRLFSPLERREDKIRILSVGRLVPRKNYKALLYSLSEFFKKTTRDADAVLIGDGPEKDALKTLSESLGIADKIHFIGNVNHGELPRHYQNADIFISTSLNEGMPNAVLEAMACGLPVLSTNIPAVDGLVVDNVNGILLKGQDPLSAAAAILELAENKNKRKSMGEASRELSLNYSFKKTTEAYLQLMSNA